MRSIWLAVAGVIVALMLAAPGASAAADHPDFSPKERQDDIGRLRDFFYPPGYSEQTIVALENGQVPAEMTVAEFARLHCGESRVVILNPCLVRYKSGKSTAYVVVAPGGNKSFADGTEAANYFRERMSQSVMDL